MEQPFFRKVNLPDYLHGKLYLHSMPGRYEPWSQFQQQAAHLGITRLVNLTDREEVRQKSPDYYEFLQSPDVGWSISSFPIQDFGVPEDHQAFKAFAQEIALRLAAGECLLIHCGAGIGRTGTITTAVLLASGLSLDQAANLVAEAGSHPETPEQKALILWAASVLPA